VAGGAPRSQVISSFSGFGKTGAFRSLNFHSVYTIWDKENRGCGVDEYDLVEDMVREWQGI
jgi:hypothetical protein